MKKLVLILTVVAIVCCFGVTAFAANVTVSSFDAQDIEAYMGYNTGLDGYGVERPAITAATGDNGNGVKIATSTEAGAIQSFYLKDADMLNAVKENAGAGKFFKIFINNPTSYTVGFRITFNGPESAAVAGFDASKVVLYNANGSKPAITTGDGGGMGKDTSIIIPANFKGYAYFPFDNCDKGAPEAWNRELLTDFSTLDNVEFDLRWAGDGFNGATLILDSAEIVDEVVATADLSVIAYAVAAITGCGALAFVKKRK